jgi:hypothetical protein
VFTQPGHTTLTPTGTPAARMSLNKFSDNATTPCLLTSYDGPNPGSSPAIDAVLTMCPPPRRCGRNAPTPWTTSGVDAGKERKGGSWEAGEFSAEADLDVVTEHDVVARGGGVASQAEHRRVLPGAC